MLRHEVPDLDLPNGVLTCRGEYCCLGGGGSPVYKGTMGPEPDREVFWVDLTGLSVP